MTELFVLQAVKRHSAAAQERQRAQAERRVLPFLDFIDLRKDALVRARVHSLGFPVILLELGFELSLLAPEPAHDVFGLTGVTKTHALTAAKATISGDPVDQPTT